MMAKVFLKDVVQRIKDNVDKDNTQLEYYIGGEHFDSGEIRITKKGVIKGSTIGPAFHMRFQPRDVLLMSRNPHLKKAGVVDFEGICSDVSYVCRTKNEQILIQDFLPFIFQTNSFWDFAEANKKGSTNFFLNWSDFEKYEFELPSIEKQKMLADLLWSIIDVKYSYKKLYTKSNELIQSRFIEMFGAFPDNPKGWECCTIRDIVKEVRYGSSRPAVEGGQYPYLRMNNITYEGTLDLSEIKYIDVPEKELEKCTVRKGDVLFNRTNSKELVGKTCLYDRDESMVLAGFIIRVRVNEKVVPEFLVAFLNMDFSKKMLFNKCKAAIGQANINAQELQDIEIYLPPLALQKEFVSLKYQVDKSKLALQESLDKLEKLQKALIKKYLG